MMGNNRFGHQHRHHNGNNSNTEQFNEIDMLIHSESPQIQEYRLYRELSKEIEKNAGDRVRYVDSEIYLRSQPDRAYALATGPSETQSAIINLSAPQLDGNRVHQNIKSELIRGSSSYRQSPSKYEGTSKDHTDINSGESDEVRGDKKIFIDGNCQVCLVKELKDDLTNITKVIQKRNEQLTSRLKDRRLRAVFERQMLD